jgi:hypothetical protein
MHKLNLALDVYRGLAEIPVTSPDTRVKVVSMLLHPFPKVGHKSHFNTNIA